MTFYLALVILVAGLVSGWTVKGWQEDASKLAAVEAVEKSRKAFAKENSELADRLEKSLANLKIVNRTINNAVEREVREKPVYLNADCAIPATGVGLLNAARGYAFGAPASKLDATLSTTPPGAANKPPAR